jgi:hypothetical protein
MPLICDVIVLLIARPAASSAALLMRLPVDNCCIAFDVIMLAELDAFDACSADMLVLITLMCGLQDE